MALASIVAAVANAGGSAAAGVQSGDQVVLTFDAPTNGYAVATANIDSEEVSSVKCQVSGDRWNGLADWRRPYIGRSSAMPLFFCCCSQLTAHCLS